MSDKKNCPCLCHEDRYDCGPCCSQPTTPPAPEMSKGARALEGEAAPSPQPDPLIQWGPTMTGTTKLAAPPQGEPPATLKADTLLGVYCDGNIATVVGNIGINWAGWQRVADYTNRQLAEAQAKLASLRREAETANRSALCEECINLGVIINHQRRARCAYCDAPLPASPVGE